MPENEIQPPEQPKPSTVVRDRLMAVLVINKEMIDSTEKVLDVLKQFPELDGDFARVFGVRG